MTGNASNRPISSHPAFRWAVGLWFAALLGAGLFVMPDGVHANIRQSLGLDTILPADVMGRSALAGLAALFGLLLGLVLAGRVTALNSANDFDDDEDAYDEADWQEEEPVAVEPLEDSPRRPFSPREFFGEGEMSSTIEADAEEEDQTSEPVARIEEVATEEPECDQVLEGTVTAQSVLPAPDVEPLMDPPAEGVERSTSEALGDLPLSALTQRLQRALEASRAATETTPAADEGELDPVIAFLRREANRKAPAPVDEAGGDAQAALRSALDRLSKVSNPR